MVAQTETRWVNVVGELGWVSMCWRVNVCLTGEEGDFLSPNNDIGSMSTEWPHATPQEICHTIWEQTARRNLEITLFPPKPQLRETKQMLAPPASLSFPLRVQGQDQRRSFLLGQCVPTQSLGIAQGPRHQAELSGAEVRPPPKSRRCPGLWNPLLRGRFRAKGRGSSLLSSFTGFHRFLSSLTSEQQVSKPLLLRKTFEKSNEVDFKGIAQSRMNVY